jgi:hypothetical protein
MLRQMDRYAARIIAFMTDNGHTGYRRELEEIAATFDEVRAEAGPNGQFCEVTQDELRKIQARYDEVVQAAIDRYEDWASD